VEVVGRQWNFVSVKFNLLFRCKLDRERTLAVKNSKDAEDVSTSFLSEKFGLLDSQIEIQSVDFDGSFFVIEGAIKKEDTDEAVSHFVVKVGRDRNVVGWKVT